MGNPEQGSLAGFMQAMARIAETSGVVAPEPKPQGRDFMETAGKGIGVLLVLGVGLVLLLALVLAGTGCVYGIKAMIG